MSLDLISLKPMNPDIFKIKLTKNDISTEYQFKSKANLNELSLTRALISICGINVDIEKKDHSSLSILTMKVTSAEDIEITAKILAPKYLNS